MQGQGTINPFSAAKLHLETGNLQTPIFSRVRKKGKMVTREENDMETPMSVEKERGREINATALEWKFFYKPWWWTMIHQAISLKFMKCMEGC